MPTKTQYQKRRKALRNECVSGGWYDHWRELNQWVMPRSGVFDQSSNVYKGEKRGQNIINSRATKAARTLGYGMTMGVTSPARPGPGSRHPIRRWPNTVRSANGWTWCASA